MPYADARSGRAAFDAVLLGSLLLVSLVFLPLFKPLFLAAVIAGALHRPAERLARSLGGRRRAAAGLAVLALSLLALAPLSLLTVYLVTQAVDLAQSAVAFVRDRGIEGIVALLPDRLEPLARERLAALPSSLGASFSKIANQGIAALGTALSRTGTMALNVAMMLVALFFLLADGRLLVAWLRTVSPLGDVRTAELFGELHRTATSVLSSTVATAAVQGAVATGGYALARVPAPAVFGFLTFLCAFIPAIGAALVGVVIAVALLLTGHLVAGGFLLGWSLFVTGTIDNVLKPWLAKGGAGLHGSVVFFSMIGGVLAFGGIGLLLGPTAVTFFVSMVRLSRQEPAGGQRTGERAPPRSGKEGEPMQPH